MLTSFQLYYFGNCISFIQFIFIIYTVYFHHEFSVITWRASNERPYKTVFTCNIHKTKQKTVGLLFS